MIRLLKDCIAVRIIPAKQVPLQAAPVNAANVDGAENPADGDDAAASDDGWNSVLGTTEPAIQAAPEPAPPATEPEKQVARRLASVLGVGPGRLATSFAGHPMPLIPLKVKFGDVVIIPQMLASETVMAPDGKECLIIHECDVLAVVEEGNPPDGKFFADPV